MNIQKYHFPSATGVCEIYGNIYTPDNGEVKAVLCLHHGMAEHQGRYYSFIEYLVDKGLAVYMYDMANHGMSNQVPEHTGYFGKKDGYKGLVADFNTSVTKAKNDYPDKKIIVMGHSMGSFIVRCFTAWYNDAGISGAVYMGTGGSNPIAGIGDKLSLVVSKLGGETRKSKALDKITFGSYGSKFEKRTAFDWLTRDTQIVDKYIADDMCGFLFSAQGMNDLVKLNIATNTKGWYENVPKDLPIMVVSGSMDPVGNYSLGLIEIENKLKKSGHTNVTLKLYNEGRHEVLNETNKDEVYADVYGFMQSIIQ